MKEIVMRVDDAAFERLMGMLSLCPSVEVVEVNETAVLSSGPLAIRIRHAIVRLREERLLRRMYDYAWLKVAMDSDDDLPSFESAHAARGQLFNWTFSDTSDAQETTRRNNIVKRFFNLMRGRI